MVVIPFIQYASFFQQVTLDGVPYNYEFNFNGRGQFWTMIIRNTDDDVLVAGIKLVLTYELTARFRHFGITPGETWGVDTSDTLESIGFDDLISNVKLVYVPDAELEAA